MWRDDVAAGMITLGPDLSRRLLGTDFAICGCVTNAGTAALYPSAVPKERFSSTLSKYRCSSENLGDSSVRNGRTTPSAGIAQTRQSQTVPGVRRATRNTTHKGDTPRKNDVRRQIAPTRPSNAVSYLMLSSAKIPNHRRTHLPPSGHAVALVNAPTRNCKKRYH